MLNILAFNTYLLCVL